MIHDNSQSLPALVSERLNISVMSLANRARTGRIVRHYLDQIADGHMTLADAVERCCGDICGRNYAPGAPQNETPRFTP